MRELEKKLVKIELTEKEAKVFKWFRRYQNIWEKMFEMRNGKITLHLNNKGEIRKKEFHYYEPEPLDRDF